MVELKTDEMRRRAQNVQARILQSSRSKPQSASHQDLRQNMVVQTDDFLEELADEIFEQDSGTQTDATDDRPQLPVFKPRDVGVEAATQIEDGELFQFDIAVEPILEVLVGKSLDQGLTEVLEEEELKVLRAQRSFFEQKRNAAISEAQRLEAECLRRFEEKERRLAQARARAAAEKAMATKVAACTTARNYLSNLQVSVLSSLQQQGVFYEPLAQQVEFVFMPYITQLVDARLQDIDDARREVDALLAAAVSKVKFEIAEKARVIREAREAEERRVAEERARVLQAELDRQAAAEEERRAREEAERPAGEDAEAADGAEGDEKGPDGEEPQEEPAEEE